MSKILTSLKGQLLVASPVLNDTFFEHGVIYICEHTPEATMGMVINMPARHIKFKDILADMGIAPQATTEPIILHGGPVEQNRGFVLHPDTYRNTETVVMGNGIALSASAHIVNDIAKGKGPTAMNFCLGYAGWGEGQIETEMRKDCWHIVPATPELVFSTPMDKRYDAALHSMGLDVYTGPIGHA